MDDALMYLQSASKRSLLIVGLIIVGVIFFIIGVFQYFSSPNVDIEYLSSEQNPTVEAQDLPDTKQVKGVASGELVVDVSGEVEKPGVYTLHEGDRIKDALVVSGGLTSNADRDYIAKTMNLAQKVTDGMKVYVPGIGQIAQQSGSGIGSPFININTASVSELDKLSGVGEVTANKIIEGRPYTTIDDLINRKIITKKQYSQIQDKISVN